MFKGIPPLPKKYSLNSTIEPTFDTSIEEHHTIADKSSNKSAFFYELKPPDYNINNYYPFPRQQDDSVNMSNEILKILLSN